MKTRDEELCWEFMQQLYEKLQTNYLDVLFLHNCDDLEDLDQILISWMYSYARGLKETGRAKLIGISSHNTKIAMEAIKSGKDCIYCGSCTKRCPFGIDASANMKRAQDLFGY